MIRARAAAWSTAAAFCLLSAAVAADVTKAQCIAGNTAAQSHRREGKLAAAREQLRMCSNPKCPALVATDCTKRLDELEAAQPTIVFDVKDGMGRDLVAVNVSVDGHLLTDRIDGTALAVDPGEHVFTFTVPEETPISRSLVLREGEKRRHERIVVGSPPATAAVATPTHSPPPPPMPVESDRAGLGTQKTLGLGAAGLGVAGVAVGTVFGLMAASEARKQKTNCESSSVCPNFDAAATAHANGLRDSNISTAAFIASGALLAGGAILFFTAGRSSDEVAPRAGSAFVVFPSVSPYGAGLMLRDDF
jgi:hypothetical protein